MSQDLKSKEELTQENIELKKVINGLESEIIHLKEKNNTLETENKNLKDKRPCDGGFRIEPKLRK